MKPKQYIGWIGLLTVIVALTGTAESGVRPDYYLDSVISINQDMLNIGTDGTDLIVLALGLPGRVQTYDTNGNLLHNYAGTSNYYGAVTWDGTGYVLAERREKAYYRMSSTGVVSGPYGSIDATPTGLTFDGSSLWVSEYAWGVDGILDTTLTRVNPVTFARQGTITVTADTHTDITATPTYGVAWYEGDLFVSFQFVGTVYRFDSDRNLVQEIPLDTDNPRGITVIDGDLFVEDRQLGKIYRYAPVPEPGTLLLLSLGCTSLIRNRRVFYHRVSVLARRRIGHAG
tara:strand:+ start:2071 stop:2928 length:858 start_codon:yes stop_codon:yes gene_type:complete